MQKRLLTGKYGEDVEKRMLTQMGLQFGVHFTQKLVRMLSDAKLSEDINAAFAESGFHARVPRGLDFHVTVMALGVWPVPQTYRQFACQPPPELMRCQQAFQEYYLGSEIGRGKKCTWIMREGLLTLRATFPRSGRRYDVQSSPHQLFPLLAFQLDNSTELPLGELQRRTGITPGNLSIILSELHERGLVVLDKEQGRARLNGAFRSEKRTVIIPSKKMEEDRDTAARGELVRDRTEKLRAIVVRTMKSRKILPYQELIAETSRQCTHFEPDVRLIKVAIESCIEGEYLERLSGDRQGWLQYLP
jgi:DNA-binding MarR family transcriptional regulator